MACASVQSLPSLEELRQLVNTTVRGVERLTYLKGAVGAERMAARAAEDKAKATWHACEDALVDHMEAPRAALTRALAEDDTDAVTRFASELAKAKVANSAARDAVLRATGAATFEACAVRHILLQAKQDSTTFLDKHATLLQLEQAIDGLPCLEPRKATATLPHLKPTIPLPPIGTRVQVKYRDDETQPYAWYPATVHTMTRDRKAVNVMFEDKTIMRCDLDPECIRPVAPSALPAKERPRWGEDRALPANVYMKGGRFKVHIHRKIKGIHRYFSKCGFTTAEAAVEARDAILKKIKDGGARVSEEEGSSEEEESSESEEEETTPRDRKRMRKQCAPKRGHAM